MQLTTDIQQLAIQEYLCLLLHLLDDGIYIFFAVFKFLPDDFKHYYYSTKKAPTLFVMGLFYS